MVENLLQQHFDLADLDLRRRGGVDLEDPADFARLGDETLEVKALRRWRPRDFYASPDYSELGAFKIARQHQIAAPAAARRSHRS